MIGVRFMGFFLLLFRLFAQGVGDFFFTRSRRDDLPALGFQLFGAYAHSPENFFHVITSFAGDFFPNAVNLREDFVFFHGSSIHQIVRRANDRAGVTAPFAEALNLPDDGDVVDVFAIPSQQIIHPVNGGHRNMQRHPTRLEAESTGWQGCVRQARSRFEVRAESEFHPEMPDTLPLAWASPRCTSSRTNSEMKSS